MLALGGCATSFQLDNEVRSFSSLTAVPAQPTYRFERLPLQQTPQQGEVEAFADSALFNAGLRRDDAAPRYSVQVSARVQRALSPWADPWDGWGGVGVNVGIGIGTGPWGLSPFGRMEQPWYRREVSVILRELASQKVVYESHAVSDGPWSDNAAVLPAMFGAALQGFPAAPSGVRKVNIQVPAR
ncbi:MAG: DUF4136 domain-containing protein [Ramlibacter sp.]|nr:DUF4136 domain-containing protein [Ramlibacter sp.]